MPIAAPLSPYSSTAPIPAAGPGALPGGAERWHERLSLLLESTGDGIYGIDDGGRCTFINRAGARMLGWRTEEVLGRNMHDLIHHRHADGSPYPESDIDSEVLWRADGTSFPAEYSSYPIVQDGRLTGAVVTFVDITERKRSEELLRQARDELERRVAERTAELSAALGHLRELAAYAETVREDERTRIAREIHDELVDNVGRIITDLRPSILDHQGLWAALEWQAQEFAGSAELDADIQVVVPAGAVAPQGGQATAVFRIFQEILSNVARHAKARRVSIRIDVDPPPGPVLYIEVRDDGVGAPPDALNHPRSYGVMGMRERARHFGGRLTIDSAPGQGTRVRLVMPIEELPT